MRLTAICATALIIARTAMAQAPLPEPVAIGQPIPAALDTAYPGVIALSVDATDLEHRIFAIRETVPVTPGPLTLLYPEWLPGEHGPDGRVDRLAGLMITAKGRRLTWRRDPANVYAFHVDVPAGVDSIDLDFQALTPTTTNQGAAMMSGEIVNLEWDETLLYPAGHFVRQIMIAPTLRLPADWTYGTALEQDAIADGTIRFKPVTVATLVDSPVFAGRYGKKIDLDPKGRSRVTLDVFADRPELLAAKPEQITIHRELIRQADKLFGARHYDHYDMLLLLSDRVSGVGLEHHRSSENGTRPGYFLDWDKSGPGRDLLAHEYTHSWNGKFRRPADLWTPDFNHPMGDSLLWVYEGQTQYWGLVLAARSGLLSREQVRDAIGLVAATYQQRPARTWRDLQDTTNDPIMAMRRPEPWLSWQRSEDYYNEGLLVWLDADTLIRELSKGRKSLDDFARAFFGIEDGRWTTVTYTFDDVVAALNAVQPYDWAAFLHQRLDGHDAAPLGGLERGGYRLRFTDTPSAFVSASELRGNVTDYTYSLGFSVRPEGDIATVIWDTPAYKAGMVVGQRLIAVNGVAYSADRLREAVKEGGQIDFLMKDGDYYKTLRIDAQTGIRYPQLERIVGTPARLDDILAPRK